MTSEKNENSCTPRTVVKEGPLFQHSESSSFPRRDSDLTKGLKSNNLGPTTDLTRFDLQKEQLANKIKHLEDLVNEATTYSKIFPEMEFRSSAGFFANPKDGNHFRDSAGGEPWPPANRNPAEIPPVGETHFAAYSEPLENDDLNETIASSSETLVGEGPETLVGVGPEDQTTEEGAGGTTPTYGYQDYGSSFQFTDSGPRYCKPNSFGEKGEDLQLFPNGSNQMTSADNFVRNFDDFVEMRVNDAPRKEKVYLVATGHPRDLPVKTKSINFSSNVNTHNQEKSKLKSSYLDGPSCRPKERRKQLKKSWSNQEALEPPASPDRRASFNDLFSFTADEFYKSRLGGSPMTNSEDTINTYSDGYTDSSLLYGEDRSENSFPNLDMNGRNIAEQINLTFKSKYNYDSELKLPVDIKSPPATSFGLPPDPNYVNHLNTPRNLHKKYGSEIRKASPRGRRISKPLSVAETDKIYSSIKQSSNKMHRQLAVSDDRERLESSNSRESQLDEQLHPNFDSFSCDGQRNEELANLIELERKTKLFFETMNKTDKETLREDEKSLHRGRHLFPEGAADLPRPCEFETSNMYNFSSKSRSELDPNYDEQFYNFDPASDNVREEDHPLRCKISFELEDQKKTQDSELTRFESPSKFPSDERPTPPTTLKFLEALNATSLFSQLGPLDRARSGPSTPIRPDNGSILTSPRMRSHGNSIHDSFDLATRTENYQQHPFGSQPWLLGNLPTEEIHRSKSFAMTACDQICHTRSHGDIQLQPLYPQRRQRMESSVHHSLMNSRETIAFGSLSPENPFETTTFEVSHSSQVRPSFGDDFLPESYVSDPPSPVARDLLKPPEGAPIRRGSIVSCDTLQASLDPHPDPVKIVVLGDDGVGKTALIVRLVTGRFIGDYDPSLEAVYSYRIPLAGYTEQLQLMDTAGQGALRGEETQLQWADAVLVVFSVTSARSLSVAGDILRHLKKGERRERKERSVLDGKGREGENQEQVGANEKNFNERCMEGKVHDEEKGNTEKGLELEAQTKGTDTENSDKNKTVEGKYDAGEPESVINESNLFESRKQTYGFESAVDPKEIPSETIFCTIPKNTQENNTEVPNEIEFCQGLVGVASLRKIALARLTGVKNNNCTNACIPPEDIEQEGGKETQEEEDQTLKYSILTTECFRNIEDSKNYSKIADANSPTSLVEIPRETTDETRIDSLVKSTGVSECNPATSTVQNVKSEVGTMYKLLCCENDTIGKTLENNLCEMNLSGTVDIEDNTFLGIVQNISNAHSASLNNTIVNAFESSTNEENNTSNPVTLKTCSTLNDSSIMDCKKYLEHDSFQQENKSSISTQTSLSFSTNLSPITGVSDTLSNFQTSTHAQESTTPSHINLVNKELSEDTTFFLCKETVLLGNKADLEHRREVSTAEGAAVAEQYHCHYTEIAASASWEVVSEPFLDLYRQVLEGRSKKLQNENCYKKDKSGQ